MRHSSGWGHDRSLNDSLTCPLRLRLRSDWCGRRRRSSAFAINGKLTARHRRRGGPGRDAPASASPLAGWNSHLTSPERDAVVHLVGRSSGQGLSGTSRRVAGARWIAVAATYLAVDTGGHGTSGAPRVGGAAQRRLYICRPPAFMSDLTVGLTGWGVTASRIHTENFGSAPPKTPGIAASPPPPHAPARPPGAGPLVSFARSGLNVRWGSAFQSLLELAEACDVPVRWSCRTGVCHTCETGLVEGTVSYETSPDRCTGGRQCADLLLEAGARHRH
jgi:hypothetical protein